MVCDEMFVKLKANVQPTGLSEVDELSRVHSFRSDNEFLVELVAVYIVECNNCQRSATARIVDDVLHNTLDVTVSLGEVKLAKLGSTLSLGRVGLYQAKNDKKKSAPARGELNNMGHHLENATVTLTLCCKGEEIDAYLSACSYHNM
jgi:hypothetical protein